MAMDEQSYRNHRRLDPPFHFFAIPILTANGIVQLVMAIRHFSVIGSWWNFVVAVALLVVALLTRVYALKNQNRIIRLEETIRLTRLLPDDLKSRIAELKTSSLFALRFASDEEVSELTRSVLEGEVSATAEIKRRVRKWRPDHLRV